MGNPLLLFFLILGLVLMVLSVALVVFQRRVFEQQKRHVQELLSEARDLVEADADDDDDTDTGR